MSLRQGCLQMSYLEVAIVGDEELIKVLAGVGDPGHEDDPHPARDRRVGEEPQRGCLPSAPPTHLSMRTSRMTRTSKIKQEAMGTKTVCIQNQCSCSSAVPGKSRADMAPRWCTTMAVGWA